MKGWIEDKGRVDKYEPEIKRILGQYLIATADPRRDQEEATDLMVLELQPLRVGVRVRSHDYLLKYPNEFTIRAGRPSGVASELSKIVDGWGDFLFYGFEDETGESLAAWFIGNLKVFRATLIREAIQSRGLLSEKYKRHNGDGSSFFFAWPLDLFPPEFIVTRRFPG